MLTIMSIGAKGTWRAAEIDDKTSYPPPQHPRAYEVMQVVPSHHPSCHVPMPLVARGASDGTPQLRCGTVGGCVESWCTRQRVWYCSVSGVRRWSP